MRTAQISPHAEKVARTDSTEEWRGRRCTTTVRMRSPARFASISPDSSAGSGTARPTRYTDDDGGEEEEEAAAAVPSLSVVAESSEGRPYTTSADDPLRSTLATIAAGDPSSLPSEEEEEEEALRRRRFIFRNSATMDSGTVSFGRDLSLSLASRHFRSSSFRNLSLGRLSSEK